ncbi:hypothetical protein B0T13DRAFT_471528 [Neurospora crassa]|nr:hypothetical protein B0T13DRAFT_471528 [Neurospora crassa]
MRKKAAKKCLWPWTRPRRQAFSFHLWAVWTLSTGASAIITCPVGILRICGLEIGGHARDKRGGTFGSSHEVILIKLNRIWTVH